MDEVVRFGLKRQLNNNNFPILICKTIIILPVLWFTFTQLLPAFFSLQHWLWKWAYYLFSTLESNISLQGIRDQRICNDSFSLKMSHYSEFLGRLLWRQFHMKRVLIYYKITVNNWSFEILHSWYVWINVERIDITTQTIKESLSRKWWVIQDIIRLLFGNFGNVMELTLSFISKSTLSSNHHSKVINES